jgi:hypothetical protein
VRIRAACSSDVTDMMLSRREAILAKGHGYYEQSTIEAWAVDRAVERVPRYLQQISDRDLIVLIAEKDDDVLGFVIADPVNSELCAIYVKPNDSGARGELVARYLRRLKGLHFGTRIP